MKRFFSKPLRWVEKLGSLFRSKTTLARRTVLRTEAREREADEAERLDRLRNPGNYRGK
ncbi:MAG TPA: hypothetical protein VNT99_01310 [Methylomirabilota bacterium]|nr:hypothetical protein [Methylomirabilota bacterium]